MQDHRTGPWRRRRSWRAGVPPPARGLGTAVMEMATQDSVQDTGAISEDDRPSSCGGRWKVTRDGHRDGRRSLVSPGPGLACAARSSTASMLASHVAATPRPRPPAKLRRSSSRLKLLTSMPAPPPYEYSHDNPYAASLPTLLGSPLPATSQLMRTLPEDHLLETKEWMNEKSRGELSDLLIKAGNVIADRENGMSIFVVRSHKSGISFSSQSIPRAEHDFQNLQEPVRD